MSYIIFEPSFSEGVMGIGLSFGLKFLDETVLMSVLLTFLLDESLLNSILFEF
jgi:hypothetical protein